MTRSAAWTEVVSPRRSRRLVAMCSASSSTWLYPHGKSALMESGPSKNDALVRSPQ